jgi:YihY family inner membrane protein
VVRFPAWLERELRKVEPIVDRGERHWAVKLARNYFDDDPDAQASMLAYAAVFSLLPILSVTFFVLTYLLEVAPIRNEVLDLIADDVPPSVYNLVENVFSAGAGNRSLLGLIAIVTLLLGGTRLYNAMDRTCAHVFRAPRRSRVKRRLFTLIAMPLIPLLLLASSLVTVFATAILTLPVHHLIDLDPSARGAALATVTAYLLAFSMLFLAYWRIPVMGPGVRPAAEAAAVTAAIFVLVNESIPLYFRLTGGQSLYGSLFGFMLVLLVVLYVFGHVFIIGAEIAAYRSGQRRRADPPPRHAGGATTQPQAQPVADPGE